VAPQRGRLDAHTRGRTSRSGDSGRPHLAHARASGAAHSSQNFAPASFWCWHRGHFIRRTSPSAGPVRLLPRLEWAERTRRLSGGQGSPAWRAMVCWMPSRARRRSSWRSESGRWPPSTLEDVADAIKAVSPAQRVATHRSPGPRRDAVLRPRARHPRQLVPGPASRPVPLPRVGRRPRWRRRGLVAALVALTPRGSPDAGSAPHAQDRPRADPTRMRRDRLELRHSGALRSPSLAMSSTRRSRTGRRPLRKPVVS
jgi:hypothetical protein